MIPAIGLLFAFIFVSISIGYDDKGKFRLFALSSPASAADYVLSKFALSWIVGLLTLAATLIVGSFVFQAPLKELLLISAISFATPLFMASVVLPPLLYLGEEKARVVIVVVYIGVFIGMNRLGKHLLFLLEKVTQMKTYPWGPGLMVLGIFLLIHLIAIVITINLVKRKDY